MAAQNENKRVFSPGNVDHQIADLALAFHLIYSLSKAKKHLFRSTLRRKETSFWARIAVVEVGEVTGSVVQRTGCWNDNFHVWCEVLQELVLEFILQRSQQHYSEGHKCFHFRAAHKDFLRALIAASWWMPFSLLRAWSLGWCSLERRGTNSLRLAISRQSCEQLWNRKICVTIIITFCRWREPSWPSWQRRTNIVGSVPDVGCHVPCINIILVRVVGHRQLCLTQKIKWCKSKK